MQIRQVRLRWQNHPLALATGVLLFVCALMVTQKFLRFGNAPNYDLVTSLVYNLVTIVPFSICVAAGLIVRHAASGWSWQRRALVITVLGIGLVAIYAVTISGVLYGFGMSTDWPSEAFLTKYISGPLHVHAALFALMQFVPMPTRSRLKTNPLMKAPPEIFGIPVSEVLAIEADDHYVWVHTRNEPVLERVTMRDLGTRLPDNFTRVHRSHIVNMDQVGGLKRTGRTVHLLVGDRMIPVSASRRPLVMEHLPPRVQLD